VPSHSYAIDALPLSPLTVMKRKYEEMKDLAITKDLAFECNEDGITATVILPANAISGTSGQCPNRGCCASNLVSRLHPKTSSL